MDAVGGRTLAITGTNGSGKSTLVRVLAGVMRPSRGEVVLKTGTVFCSRADRPFRCGLVAPYLSVYDRFTPRENLRFIGRARSMDNLEGRIESTLEEVGLPGRMDDLVMTFSSGMKQRVRLAAALLPEPDVLLLDEPSSNLDEEGRRTVEAIVDRTAMAGRIVIVATNDSREADRCQDRLDVLDFQ